MKNKFYTIQIIPSSSGKTKVFKLHGIIAKFFFWLFIIIILFGCVLIYKLTEINAFIITAKNIKQQNELLIKKQKEYATYFEQLDSIYTIQNQIQNILGTYYENDPNNLASLIEKEKLKNTSVSKTKLDLDGVHSLIASNKNTDFEKIPNIIPVIGVISKKFETDKHNGTDFAANKGDPVFATASGYVIFASNRGDLGLTLVLDHGNGYTSSYSHLQTLYVKKKSWVKKGEVIGSIGSTGNSTGPHLHYEIQFKGQYIDPETLLNE